MQHEHLTDLKLPNSFRSGLVALSEGEIFLEIVQLDHPGVFVLLAVPILFVFCYRHPTYESLFNPLEEGIISMILQLHPTLSKGCEYFLHFHTLRLIPKCNFFIPS